MIPVCFAPRGELKTANENDEARKITVNDFILKAAVVAALREPKVNASFEGEAIVQYGDINLAVAVAIEEGLVTPVIRGAQNKSLLRACREKTSRIARHRCAGHRPGYGPAGW